MFAIAVMEELDMNFRLKNVSPQGDFVLKYVHVSATVAFAKQRLLLAQESIQETIVQITEQPK